jgi:hypothetical protein
MTALGTFGKVIKVVILKGPRGEEGRKRDG